MKTLKNIVTAMLSTLFLLIIMNTNVNAKTVIVDTDTLKLREKPSTDSTTIELLNNGQKMEYLDEENEWYKVKINGITGYVSKDYTKIVAEEEKKSTTESNSKPEENVEEKTTEENKNPVPQKNEEITTIADAIKLDMDSNVYILPLINSTIIQKIKAGTTVSIITKTNTWYYVETDETMGWIKLNDMEDTTVVSDDIPLGDEKQEETKPETEKKDTDNKSQDTEITSKVMYVNNDSIYVRKGPGTDYEIVDSLILNDTVKVVAENGDWYKVEIENKTGYIAKRLLSNTETQTTSRSGEIRKEETNQTVSQTTNNATKGEQLVEEAKKYLGCKYVYGASGPNTFDCSGFTMFIFKQYGYSLSHSATAQSKLGEYVSKENLQAGDLVFFTDYETGSGIGHCGIYIGNGDFIHASSGTGYCVKISTLLTGSYNTRYETARRLKLN